MKKLRVWMDCAIEDGNVIHLYVDILVPFDCTHDEGSAILRDTIARQNKINKTKARQIYHITRYEEIPCPESVKDMLEVLLK